jgi:hypothetical protein
MKCNSSLKKTLKKLFELNPNGSEEEYIYGLQPSAALKKRNTTDNNRVLSH